MRDGQMIIRNLRSVLEEVLGVLGLAAVDLLAVGHDPRYGVEAVPVAALLGTELFLLFFAELAV